MTERGAVVTIDGPAGSGKSSTARAVAQSLGYRHLDSGALFRAVTLGLLRSGIPEEQWSEVSLEQLEEMRIQLVPSGTGFDVEMDGDIVDKALRGPEVTQRVPKVARIPAVRDWLLRRQRAAAKGGGVVVDGRDTGSVVFPDASVKVFLTAGIEERARRRLLQDQEEGQEPPSMRAVRREAERLAERDRQDETREIAPLRRPEGAIEVDTTGLSFEEQVARVVEAVRRWG
ncbi:MAG: (d)CMP kinase [Gemmatimonadales bacterium]|nr:MAG: (d)CMP kinase [Gemmatimonadales bacterium]